MKRSKAAHLSRSEGWVKQIDLKDQYFGTEIEMTGISRYDAAVAIGRMFGTEPYHIRSYDSWCVKDSDGKRGNFQGTAVSTVKGWQMVL